MGSRYSVRAAAAWRDDIKLSIVFLSDSYSYYKIMSWWCQYFREIEALL
jgi:hypothetical protein